MAYSKAKLNSNGDRTSPCFQLTTEAKYLEHTLNKRLTWKAQLKNGINKACRASWTCKGTFGKTWDVTPRVGHWINIMVIRPVLTYDSAILWPRVRYDVSRTELTKVQRLDWL